VGHVVAFCGGGGGAKLALGLSRVLPAGDLTIVVNPGDDFEHLGLLICPDFDSVIYTLSNRVDARQGWGRSDESWRVLEEIGRLHGPQWFRLGDRDIALHLLRLTLRREGMKLTQIADRLRLSFGIQHSVLPPTDDPLQTVLETDEGILPFQRYFVERRCVPQVKAVKYVGAEQARLTEQVEAVLNRQDLVGVIIAPSNPYLSIAPMLAIPALAQRLGALNPPILAVSPIVAGKALKGPAAKMMAELGVEPTAVNVAQYYGNLLDGFVLDEQDGAQTPDGKTRYFVTNTVMESIGDREDLARQCIRMLAELQ
jgi:LPPG:FO 2-phospho-L-lactate transferase